MNKQKERSLPVWWSWSQENQIGKKRKLQHAKLIPNPIPSFLAILIYCGFLYYLLPLQEIIATYVFKFVEFLQIPKVLKIQLLTDPRLYQYSALILVGYVGFAFFIDLWNFLEKNLLQSLSWEGEKIKLVKWSLLGKESVRWNPHLSGLQIMHKSGLLRSFLGLEKIVFYQQTQGKEVSVLAESPYFHSKKNREFLDSILHR
ncbi:hypothetical protein CH373_06755 [Leptospira perolatii]|uniref:DUF304 domain-containing protein n=1 Tax=Leptospira perolatii TaxID=2023191 RepID=A0A2M9ZP57_9LEPT|nr:hypothetical protein [Leptospira perolatii]PJZ70636.1 hypothetical protein CH360_03615 [Leptospira perolatii]PJZ73847.1 hypothetical protein CH373_06755 [Leptospira perolatii]